MLKKAISKEQKNNKKIVIIGGFGSKDIGDEAMPKNDILKLRERVPNLNIVMLSEDPEYTRDYHGEKSVLNIGSGLKEKPVKMAVAVC